jgi:hypothetical protein
MTPKRFSAVGLPVDPNIRIRLFCGRLSVALKFFKSNRRVDVATHRGTTSVDITLQQGLHGLLEKRFAEGGIARCACPHCLVKIFGQ